MKKNSYLALLVGLLFPGLAQAWWNDDWASRRQVSVDASVTGADIQDTLSDFPVLVRLHAGNFGYFAELAENGRDLRFLKDDTTPLSYQVEQVDPFSEMGLVWVKLPQVRGGIYGDNFWMYYGNANAPDGSNSQSLYDVAQGLVFHFKEGETLPQDATAYRTHAVDSKAQILAAGWIGAAAQLTGAGPITVAAAPQLTISADKGWTFSSWLKLEADQSNARLLTAKQADNGLELFIEGTTLSARWIGEAGVVETTPIELGLGNWRQLAVVLNADKLLLYLDGAKVAEVDIELSDVDPEISIGDNLQALLDEVQIAATARSADWIKLSFRSQSPDFVVLAYGEDETNDTGDSNLLVIFQSTTVDGWMVIALTMIMLVISLLVMFTKAMVVRRIRKDNRLFLEKYRQLDYKRLGSLDHEDSEEERELADSDFLAALVGKHDHFQSSTLYHLYHLAISELKQLQVGPGQVVSVQAWNFLKVKLDSQVINEVQRLNSHMVLLTIAVAGGPFLGLLGTVVGVMNTFAAIAATGDVNINSIAPGISAALLTTVAGLAVAIPSLFGYNYLMTRIKEITVSMKVFADEFLAVLSMRAAHVGEQ